MPWFIACIEWQDWFLLSNNFPIQSALTCFCELGQVSDQTRTVSIVRSGSDCIERFEKDNSFEILEDDHQFSIVNFYHLVDIKNPLEVDHLSCQQFTLKLLAHSMVFISS